MKIEEFIGPGVGHKYEPETKKKAQTSKPATAPATSAAPDDSKKQPQPAPGTPAAPASGAAR